ncbi:uncharacterized protein Dana_GF17305 [Drosophila ananassae]|uniref:Uncharacterized protein n=1 Tax=Drosophila ananassae TaxID=7217 RepID=B3LYG7_DROAN|nr:uncharacterized protein LOC6500090 [Drosophila ananassae]EDV41830.1 uncharacterized protein Dana_GF17305 [Drosophila ananassae]
MSVSGGESSGVPNHTTGIWSRTSHHNVVEAFPIGDGPHVIRHRPNQAHRHHPQHHQHLRMLPAAEHRPRTPPLRRIPVLRKIGGNSSREFQRNMDFYYRLRNSGFGGPTSGFGYRQLRQELQLPAYGNWPMSHSDIEAVTSEDETEPLGHDHHWGRAQLHFQQYLGTGYQNQQSRTTTNNPIVLKLDLHLIEVKPIYDILCGLGLKEALRLAFNEVFHLQ